MLDAIRNLTDATGPGPLIRVDDRRALRERRQLLQQARDQASRLVADANAQVEQIRAHALQEGYSQGVLHAAGDIARLLLMEQGMADRLRTDVARQVEELLMQVLDNDVWVAEQVQCWMRDCGIDAQSPLQVIVPQGRARAMGERLQTHWPGVLKIESADTARFVFRQGNQVLEFDPPAMIAPLVPQLLLQLRPLKSAMGTLDTASAEHLQAWVNQVVEDIAARTAGDSHAD